jgi:hypothetical protein
MFKGFIESLSPCLLRFCLVVLIVFLIVFVAGREVERCTVSVGRLGDGTGAAVDALELAG